MQDSNSRPVRTRSKRSELLAKAPPISEWPGPLVADVAQADTRSYQLAKRAVHLWVEGQTEVEIRNETGLSLRAARRFTVLCASINAHTRNVVGFWACVPGYRQPRDKGERTRTFKERLISQGKGLYGALDDLFIRYPEIHKKLEEFIAKRTESSAAPVSILTSGNIHQRFIALCKERGLRTRNEWPFSTKRQGYEAVRRWYKRLRHQNPARTIRNEMGDDAAKLDKIDRLGASSPLTTKTYLAFERTELDEHLEDAHWSIVTPIDGNQFVHVASNRLHALVLRDCGSRVALSSGISFKDRYGVPEVLKLVYDALFPPPRKNLMIQNEHFAYDEDACFPGERADFAKLTWQVLAMDADRAHFSNQMLETLGHDVACHVYGERIGEATARYGIEGFFKLLATMHLDLPSATGNNAQSAARRDSEGAAKRWSIVAPLAEQALDVKCRNYNVTPSAQCGGISPLHRLSEMSARGQIFRSPVGELRQANLYRFLPRYPADLSRKRGPLSMGPLGVNLYGGRYVGPELAKDSELSFCGVPRVTVYVQDDARYAVIVPKAFPDRCYPVVLTGPYSDIPHTLEWRRFTYNWRKNNHIKGAVTTASLMTGILRGLGEAAKTNHAAATFLSGAVAFMDRFGRGDSHYVDLPLSKREQLGEFAIKMAELEGEEGPDQEDVIGTSAQTLRPVVSSVAPSPSGAAYDPFGLL
jgi:hypothetical protein